jgi:PIN like domain
MTADPSSLRFFFDESALVVGKALAVARRDAVHTGHLLIPEVPLGSLDPVWMPAVAARDLIVIGRDRRIRSKPGELALLLDSGLRVFWIAGKRDLSTWDYLVRLVNRWQDIERVVAERGPGPWFMAIREAGVSEIALRWPRQR